MTEFERDPRTDEEVRQYYQEKFQSLKDGNPEFIVRNFDADFGRCHDLYMKHPPEAKKPRFVGSVHQEYDYGCTAYDHTNKEYRTLNDKPLALEAAKQLLRRTVGLE